MKTGISLLIALFSLTTIAQTKIIALKRHSSKLTSINEVNEHNFGEPYRPTLDTIKYLGDGCVVQIGLTGFGISRSDTMCNQYNFAQFTNTSKELQKMYGSTTLLNLELYEKDYKSYHKEKKKTKKNSLNWLFLLLPLGLLIRFKSKKA